MFTARCSLLACHDLLPRQQRRHRCYGDFCLPEPHGPRGNAHMESERAWQCARVGMVVVAGGRHVNMHLM
ncbi:hypothetical protein PAMP_024710 [Pampus punctatissimus]